MQWIELIGVRSAAGNHERLEEKLRDFLRKMQRGDVTRTIHILRRLSVESDLCVYLLHDSKKAEPSGSRLGLHLASELKAFGLVHHSIWEKMQGKRKESESSIENPKSAFH